MKIYLAARYSRHPEMQRCRDDLEALGHTVTSRWINGDHKMVNDSMFSPGDENIAERFAVEDYEDLLEADCVISFTEPQRSTNSRGGRHVEFGIALGLGKHNVIVGPKENVFHYMPGLDVYDSWPEFLGQEQKTGES